jgi:hypothetical protein
MLELFIGPIRLTSIDREGFYVLHSAMRAIGCKRLHGLL